MLKNYLLLALCACTVLACSNKQTEEDSEPTEPVAQSPVDGDNDAMKSNAETVTFEAKGMTVHGTLTLPAGDGPFAAIAIAAGSGPTDRDWLNPLLPGSNGSAALLADALAARGVASLRYDKRGTGETGMPATPVQWGDYVAELSAALALLASHDDIDDARIYVAGHSEGGAHALRTASTADVDVAGVILLSTAGRSLRDIVLWQIGNQLKASGLNPVAQKAELDALTAAVDKIAAGETVDPARVGQLPGVQQFVAALQNPSSVEFARGLLKYDPLSSFGSFEGPVLVLSGARDIQVDPELDAKPLAEASKAAGHETTLALIETADHVLKQEETPRDQLGPQAGMRYNAPDRDLADGVADAIVDFVGE